MIDTLKMLIPLSSMAELKLLEGKLTRTRRENLKTDELEFEFHTGNFEMGTYKRSISFKSSDKPLGLFVELSIPKFVYGNNVEMLYAHEIPECVEKLRRELSERLQTELPNTSLWKIYRLDLCYNWTFESQEKCQSLMNFIQRIDFPRKQKYVYNTSVMYKGTAYTIKFYLKGPEFLKHDYKTLLETDDIKAFYLMEWAPLILRFEVEFRKNYLKDLFGLDSVTVADITDDKMILEIQQLYLDKVFRYISREKTTFENIRQTIAKNFSPSKTLRLYNFYKGYYYEADGKLMIEQGLNRSTIYRYKKDLKDIGITFTENFGEQESLALDELVIPSHRAQFTLLERHVINSK
jgi:II/X family phage/plasmid replication protein